MKYFFTTLIACIFSFGCLAQIDVELLPISELRKAVFYARSAEKSSSGERSPAYNPLVFRRVFLVTNAISEQEVFDRALDYALVVSLDAKTFPEQKRIELPVRWDYEPAAAQCFEQLQLEGTIRIEVKDRKTRISLLQINYKHHYQKNELRGPVLRAGTICAPEAGPVELLYQCNDCRKSQKALKRNLRSSFDAVATKYQDWLRSY